MKKMQIFEGAVCASDGMCGLSVDQELMRIDTVVKVLQNNAYDIDRYIMPGDRKAFLENEVAGDGLTADASFASPLFDLPNFIVTPHLGAQSVDASIAIGKHIIAKVKEALEIA